MGKVYLLAGKQLGTSGYGISLLPSGCLQGWVKNEGGIQWTVETPAAVSIVDDSWHCTTLVVDRENQRMAIFVDGLERAATTEPPGFGDIGRKSNGSVTVGEEDRRYTSSWGSGFPGALDEVRFSSTAHTAEKILEGFVGTVPFSVFSARPEIIIRGATTEFKLEGYNLCQVELTVVDSSGTIYPGQRISSSATEARFLVSVSASAALGSAQIQVQSSLGTATSSARILDSERSLFRRESDTLLLWHLDEPGVGKVKVADSGPVAFYGESAYTSSRSLPALFQRARETVNSPQSRSIDFSTSSFTIEGWAKEGRTTPSWDQKFYSNISQSSGLRLGTDNDYLYASLRDTAGKSARLELRANRYDESRREWLRATVTDGQWHHLALTVDRTAGEMRLYLDGVERAVAALPAGFGALYYDPLYGYVRVGGLWDELRISNTAHTTAKIWEDFSGEHSYQVTSVSPRVVHTGPESPPTQNLNIEGFRLGEVSAQFLQANQPADIALAISDQSYGRVSLAAVPGPNLLIGPAQLAISSPGLPETAADLLVMEQSAYRVETDTLLMWRLNEDQNGATTHRGFWSFQSSRFCRSRVEGG